MDYTREFLAEFSLTAPAYMPASLSARLTFLSCLAEKEARSVYLCRDNQSGEKVILKIGERESADSISREYALLQKLDHPAIPRALAFETDADGREYLVRGYAEGETLDRILDRDGVFDARLALDIVQKLCAILTYLHKQSPPIIYRDIKPQNVVVTPGGKVTLIDFGISRESLGDKEFDTVYVGSVAFAAPEQFGFTKTDSRSDVYALGKLMLYLLTGQTRLMDFKQHIQSRALIRLIEKCTRLSPEKRYASAQRLSRAIDRALNPPTRGEWIAGIAAALIVMGVGFALALPALRLPPEPAAPVNAPVNANGSVYEDAVKVPVRITARLNGQPLADCAVAVDNHHWFAPAVSGVAELMVTPYDEYRVRAVTGNKTAYAMASVARSATPMEISFDLGDVPSAPDEISLELAFNQAHEVPLEIANATEVTLSGQPEGITVEPRGDGYALMVSADVAEPGHYTLFLEALNAGGKADSVLSVSLTEQRPAVTISTAADFARIQDDLSGAYVLDNDIDLSGTGHWAPIGSDQYPFTGSLDGRGHRVTGLRYDEMTGESYANTGLFGVVNRGVIRNLIVEGADFTLSNTSGGAFGVLAGRVSGGLIERCATVGGRITANVGMESSTGGLVGLNAGIVRHCLNTADVTIHTVGSKDRTECYAGGICGSNSGYVAHSANTGAITGISVAGGVVGFNDMGILTRSYNAGPVKAPVFASEFPAGGVSHLLGRGKSITYCAFEAGSAEVGATVFNGGTLLGIVPMAKAELRDMGALARAFRLTEPEMAACWTQSAEMPNYPVPTDLFEKAQIAPTPHNPSPPA